MNVAQTMSITDMDAAQTMSITDMDAAHITTNMGTSANRSSL